MGVKFFCDECGKEIFKQMTYTEKITLKELLQNCMCSDCQMKEIHKRYCPTCGAETSPFETDDTCFACDNEGDELEFEKDGD